MFPEDDVVETTEVEAAPDVGEAAEDSVKTLDNIIDEAMSDEQPDGDAVESESSQADAEPDGSAGGGDAPKEAPETASAEEPSGQAGIAAPEHWSVADKEAFKELPETGRRFVLERVKAMEADYTRKTQEHADDLRWVESFRPTVQQYQPYLQQLGVSVADAVARYTGYAWTLQAGTPEQKRQVLEQLAQGAGVTLGASEVGEGLDAAQEDPRVQALNSRIAQLETAYNQTRQTTLANTVSTWSQAEQALREAKDEGGNPKFPHLDQVTDGMVRRIGADAELQRLLASDPKQAFERAYEAEVWASPQLRETLIQEQTRKAAEEAEKARKAAVDKAKSTGRAVSSGNARSQPAHDGDLDKIIDGAMEQHGMA